MSVAETERPVPAGPQGPRPRWWFAPSRIFIYGVLLVTAAFVLFPLYVLIVTSLKDVDEIRAGHLFQLPQRPTVAAWAKAWDTVCTGLHCEGIKPGFWNSVKMTVPSVVLSIFFGSICGYTMALWRFRGADFFFAVMLLAIFIPPQVILYPIAQLGGFFRLLGTPWGPIVVNSVLSIPFMTLLFRNGFVALPRELFHAARVDGAGYWRIYAQVLMPLSLPLVGVALVLQITYIWGDFMFSAVFAGPFNIPMTVLYHNVVSSYYGVVEYNVQMAATVLTGAVPLAVYFFSGRLFLRGVAAGVVPRR